MHLVRYQAQKVYRSHQCDLVEYKEACEAPAPTQMTALSAGYDLTYVGPTTIIQPGAIYLASTGIHLELPPDLCALVLPRSGLAYNHGITVLNSPGLIDPDYIGEVKVILYNAGNKPFNLSSGIRIAQLLFLRYEKVHLVKIKENESLKDTERGSKGFGSTGGMIERENYSLYDPHCD